MARCQITGIEKLIDEMERMHEAAAEVFDEMLEAGAEECKKAWKESALKHGHKDTGQMIETIDYSLKPKKAGDLKIAHIYPLGSQTTTTGKNGEVIQRKNAVRYAEIAFILHYGTSKKYGSFWVSTADEIAAKNIPEKLNAMWSAHLAGKGR